MNNSAGHKYGTNQWFLGHAKMQSVEVHKRKERRKAIKKLPLVDFLPNSLGVPVIDAVVNQGRLSLKKGPTEFAVPRPQTKIGHRHRWASRRTVDMRATRLQ